MKKKMKKLYFKLSSLYRAVGFWMLIFIDLQVTCYSAVYYNNWMWSICWNRRALTEPDFFKSFATHFTNLPPTFKR